MAKINSPTKAYLVLANGRVFHGTAFGALNRPDANDDHFHGEVVFNTSLTGYQEILTDPSYQGQIVAMTPSHIGNTGINPLDVESRKIFLSGFVVQELSGLVSNWRSNGNLDTYLADHDVPGITGVDTRTLTRLLRSSGALHGILSIDGRDLSRLVKKAKALPTLEGRDLVKEVTSKEPYEWTEQTPQWNPDRIAQAAKTKKKVVVMDFGVKQNILRSLVRLNCSVTVVPANTDPSSILNYQPDGLLFSNGPGDPAAVTYAVDTIRELIHVNSQKLTKGDRPMAMFGICLGHQLLGLALGGTTYKLKFGHHGANHPVRDLETGQVDITTQNHGFCVAGEKLKTGEWIVQGNKEAVVTHMNLNDSAIEGLRHKSLPLFSVQYHPEASAGPHDADHLFDRFIRLMEN